MSAPTYTPRFDTARPLVLIRSAGNVGSAVAHTLFKSELPVVLLQDQDICTLRWQMSFAEAARTGSCEFAGVMAKRVSLDEDVSQAASKGSFIPIVCAPFLDSVDRLAPSIIVDASIKNSMHHIVLIGAAPLTIGIGPRLVAGCDVDLVIESAWGPNLGAVIPKGRAQGEPCEPERLCGMSWERFARSPKSGIFRSGRRIGDVVQQGHEIGFVNRLPLAAPATGVIRGLLPNGVKLERGGKFIEIDPRSLEPQVTGLAERPTKIAAGVKASIEAAIAKKNVFTRPCASAAASSGAESGRYSRPGSA